MKIAVIGGGAAGFFSAITVKENYPDADVVIFEKSKKLMSKIEVSGGGRCNLTNACPSLKDLSNAYPRGRKFLKKAFRIFDNKKAMEWFVSRGVPLTIQDDNCVFPASQDSRTIIDCFLREADRLGVTVEQGKGVAGVKQEGEQLQIDFQDSRFKSRTFDRIIAATGGSPKREDFKWLEDLNHRIEDPVPSLFTFNLEDTALKELPGIVVENSEVSIHGTNLKARGPLLITHWGLSGPVILELSSLAARVLGETGYNFNIQINWLNIKRTSLVLEMLKSISENSPNKLLQNQRPGQLPERVWVHLIQRCGISEKKKWGELGKKGINRLVSILTNDVYKVTGRSVFKEEYVTCGGVSLDSINPDTMESRVCKNLYFAGELMDIDGITGGYNFQAAWTTAFIAGKLKSVVT